VYHRECFTTNHFLTWEKPIAAVAEKKIDLKENTEWPLSFSKGGKKERKKNVETNYFCFGLAQKLQNQYYPN